MSEEEKEALRQQIHGEIEKLENDVVRFKETTKPVAPDRAIGRLTRMEAINSKNMSEANMRKAQTRILALKKTLTRIDEDEDFGICISCERAIPPRRLVLVPESTRCVRCLSR